MLIDDHKMQRLMASRASLRRYRKEGDAFLLRIVTTDETWVFHYEPESKRRSMEWKHVSSPVKKKFKSQEKFKESHAYCVLGQKWANHYQFLGKGQYCELRELL